jgi:hypothetical protein
MKRLIRKKVTGEFLNADGTWTHDFSKARDFPNMLAVSKAQKDRRLEGIELVLVADKPGEAEVVLPLPSSVNPTLARNN